MRHVGLFSCAAVVLAVACSSTSGTSGTSTTTSSASASGGSGTTCSGGHGGQPGTGGATWTTSATGTGGAGTGAVGGMGMTTGTGGAGTGGGPGVTCPQPGTPDCSPGEGTGAADQCFDAPSCFLKTVQDAVKYVINAAHPEWIDWSDGNPRVLDGHHDDYVLAVVDELGVQGLCAVQDPNAGDEIVVKFDNAFSENFDILTSQGYARYGNIWTATCAPAWF